LTDGLIDSDERGTEFAPRFRAVSTKIPPKLRRLFEPLHLF